MIENSAKKAAPEMVQVQRKSMEAQLCSLACSESGLRMAILQEKKSCGAAKQKQGCENNAAM